VTDPAQQTALVFGTVGTDYHPFDRFIEWLDSWYATQEGSGVRCVVQHGSSRPPRFAEGHRELPFDEVVALSSQADAVVCQAGPASVAVTRRCGLMPIVVPRSSSLGEHVDDHQVAFARRLSATGHGILVEGADDLGVILDRALKDNSRLRVEDDASAASVGATVERFAAIADALLEQND